MHWPKEDSVSVVAAKDLHDGQKEIGQTCSVRVGKRLFPGRIAEIGKKLQHESVAFTYIWLWDARLGSACVCHQFTLLFAFTKLFLF